MIRLAPITAADAVALRDMRLRALADTPLAFGSTLARESAFNEEEWVERAKRWTSGTAAAYFALDDDVPCGIAAGFLTETDPGQANLVSMWVAPTHRRSGVGRTLVLAIIDWARSTHANRLSLMVTSWNDGAETFYERLGFTRTGLTEPYPNDPALIEHEMSLSLSS